MEQVEETKVEVIKITTKKLNENYVRKNMRVQVNNHEEYHGELGTIIDFDSGCSCTRGWCSVLLDKKDGSGDDIEEKFRYGSDGDVSDLLQVLTEPVRPEEVITYKLVSPETVKIELKVKIQPKSKFIGQSKSIGKIIEFNSQEGWVNVHFSDGSRNCYRYGHKDVDDGASDLMIV